MQPLMHATVLLLIPALLAFLVGACIQRAGICAVRATEQLVYYRRTSRMRAFFSTAAWSGLVILPLTWLLPERAMLAEAAPVTWTVLAGGALFGVGAAVNGGCALGTVAKLTCGRTEYLFTLGGIILGAIAALRLGVHSEATMPSIVAQPSWLGWAAWLAFVVVALPVVRHLARVLRSQRLRLTTVASFAILGVCGGMLHVTAGGWAYTALLAGLAERAIGAASASPYTVGLVCTLALFAGGSWAAVWLGRFAPVRPSARRCVPKLAGGAIMGFAAMMIPGGNDVLLLSGLPSLNGNAWAAYAAMMGSLGVVMLLHRAWVRQRRRVHPTDRGGVMPRIRTGHRQ
jgi:uncharacterized protein